MECLQALVVKKLVQHGWPAFSELGPFGDGFIIKHKFMRTPGADFWQAVSIACRIVGRTHRVDIVEADGWVKFNRNYVVLPHGVFREVALVLPQDD